MSETSQPSSENDNNKSQRPRGSRKRQVHNAVERRRKDKINSWISKIGELLPCKELHKQSKISILEQTVDYIKLLASEKDKLLSENCLEVHAEEIKKLKRDNKFLSEQNALFEKLLEQSNISLKHLPKKDLKYSNKLIRKNGVLTVKNAESNVSTHVDTAIQVSNMCLNVPVSTAGSIESSNPPKESYVTSSKETAENCKPSSRSSNDSKSVITVSPTTTSSVINSSALTISNPSSSIVSSPILAPAVQSSNNVAKENIIPVINWNDPARNSASFHAGGVTTVLSQFPVMSTNQRSTIANICNKNVPTFIIPSGGSLVQQSNTISVICPSTLPILVPQQVFSVPSVARNVNLQPTLICPGPLEDQTSQIDKSTLGGTLLALNSNSMVPISSSFPTNTRIILPPQPTVLGNTCGNINLTQNFIMSAVSQAQSDNLIVPFIQKQHVSSSIKNNDTVNNNFSKHSSPKINSKEIKILENGFKSNSTTSVVSPENSPKEIGNSVKKSVQNKHKKSIQDLRNLCSNSPPSLQVLSANKIIYLANQSQKVKTDILPLNKKTTEGVTSPPLPKIISVCSVESKSIQKNSNQPLESNKQKTSSSIVSQTTESGIAKSNFSLTVLIGDSSTEKSSQNTEVPGPEQKSIHENKSIETEKIQTQNEKFTHTTVGNTNCSSIPECNVVTVSSVVKQHVFSSSQTNAFSNSENCKVGVSNIKKFDSQSLLNKITSCSTNNTAVLPNSSTEVSKNNSCNFNNTSASNSASSLSCSTSYNLGPNNVASKQTLQNMTFSSKNEVQSVKSINAEQNDHDQPDVNSEIISTGNITCNENVSYSLTESSVDQSLLPSLFSSNQMVGLNSPVLVCHTGHDNMSGILLSNGIQVCSDATNQNLNPCLISDPHSDFQTFSVGNRDLILQNSNSNVHNKKITETVSTFSTNSSVVTVMTNSSETTAESEKDKIENTNEDNCNKEFSTPKRKSKAVGKECNTSSSENTVTNVDITTEITSHAGMNRNQATDNISLSKNESSACIRQDSNNFIFTSDILARATESIFGDAILENSQMPKRNEDCFADESSNLNVPLSASEKAVDSSYKLHYSCIREGHNSDISSEKNKKNISGISQHSSAANSPSLQNEERNILELNPKQNKLCKVRKSKAAGDSEPPCKKMKEISQSPEKSPSVSNFSQPHEADKGDKNLSTVHSNLSFLEKQVSSPSQNSMEDQNGVGESMGNFPNQVQLSENNCKTPSSVDNIFSLTPMLGDILKDVSHNTNLDTRSTNFLMGNENQNVFSSEKSLISYNYANNSNEDYLNLPRMYFPIIPETSSAPVVHVTNVSFAHSVSLCSTQSDSQKSTETHPSTDSQNKSNSNKKKDIPPLFHNNHNILNLDLANGNNVLKQSECVLKVSNSDTQFNIASAKGANSSVHFDTQHSDALSHNLNSASASMAVSQSSSQYGSRDNFIGPASHPLSFYPTICSSSNAQNFSCTTSSLPHLSYHNNSSSMGSVPVSFQTSGNTSNSFNTQSVLPKPDSLSHSLCSLLKENSNVENRGTNETSSQNTSSASNVIQSKYSALSLISDQTYSESVSATTCHPQFVQTSAVYTTSASEGQYTSTVSSCGRNPKTSLSYSAESLLQTSCINNEKNKNKSNNNRFPLRNVEKKTDRNNLSNMHSMSETNIFMPVTNCDINIQTAPLVPLPPVTSFHNFSSAYTICETVPSTTIFSSSARAQDIPLSLSNENFLNHMNLNVDSQMLSNRHEASPTVPKPHSNIPLSFEYNNCNFLPHVKPTLEASRSSEASACFQSSTYSNNYTQQSQQKTNCCHFSHRAVATNSDLPSDINLPTPITVASFHNEKNNFQANRAGLQTSFSQSNSNFMGNFFYNTSPNCRDGNDMNIKPSSNRSSQEMYVPEGVRQNIHDQSIVFNSRKTVPSSRTKSKKPKNATSNENNNAVATCITNYSASQDSSCNKSNLSYVPNGYFKSSSHPVLPPPTQIQCSQNKISEAVPPSVIPANPSFNAVLHQQGDNFLNLNFQHPNFTMSPLPRPPTQPLSCSCLTTPIISHTFSSSTPHPVPNFNLSNILPDMGCSGNQVSFSPAKFPVNHPPSTQCQTNPTITNSAHIVSHQSCAPSLYPPHPPMVRATLNPILGHNSQSLIDSQVSLVGTAGAVMSQNTTFTATQNPTFRNVMHSITFPRNDR